MNTRAHLLAVAERLFAERGIDAVSLREINRVAGQANASALHYHFGSRDALIEAIVCWRMPPVDERRTAILGGAALGELTPVALAEAMVLPLSELVRAYGPDENGWLCFLAQVYAGGRVDIGSLVRRLGCDASLRLLARHARAVLPHVPRALLDQRLVMCVRQSVRALADWQRAAARPQGRTETAGFDLFEANLIDVVAAALAAPVSARTAACLALQPQASQPDVADKPSRVVRPLRQAP